VVQVKQRESSLKPFLALRDRCPQGDMEHSLGHAYLKGCLER
jgi:hypothetical protein